MIININNKTNNRNRNTNHKKAMITLNSPIGNLVFCEIMRNVRNSVKSHKHHCHQHRQDLVYMSWMDETIHFPLDYDLSKILITIPSKI